MTFNRREEALFAAGYRVTDAGQCLSPQGQPVGFTSVESRGTYVRVNALGGLTSVHRLQAFQKYGAMIYNPEMVVRHIDGNGTNNSAANVAIGTQADNANDISPAVRAARSVPGSAAITKHNHADIIAFYRNCQCIRDTMVRFGVSHGTLHYILNRSVTATKQKAA